MDAAPSIRRVDLGCRPLDLLAAWRRDVPLLMLHSGGGDPTRRGRRAAPAGRWARWSIVAAPAGWFTLDRRSRLQALEFGGERPRFPGDAAGDLDAILGSTRPSARPGAPLPFAGGWIGYLAYDLGFELEPVAGAPRPGGEAAGFPLVQLARCPAALVHDHATSAWYAIGDADWRSWIEDPPAEPEPDRCETGPWRSSLTPDAYLTAVSRTLDYIAAGDVFQVNVAHRLAASFRGSTRALARRALARSGAWYGAYLELPGGRRIVSMSPELFLQVEPAGAQRPGAPAGARVLTRPIKGTRPCTASRRELAASEKDAAELHMIVDLLRNDLGRVCAYGSVQVPAARAIESHGTVHHGVGEITGRLREGVTAGDLLRATFPGGSVTGAPKIRAMQIIDELEPVDRGPYCGAIGFLSDTGDARLSIAIRTMLLQPSGPAPDPRRLDLLDGRLDYSVGAGIVADSDPASEYRETMDKAEALMAAIGSARRRAGALVGEGE